MVECFICNKPNLKIDKHHLSYKENITIDTCRSCHKKIHTGNHHQELMPKDFRKFTDVSINKSTKALLDKLKIHPNQSYDEIIREIIKKIKV